MAQDHAQGSNSFLDIIKVFGLLGVTSFGGPIAHIGFFRTEFVERRRWLSDEQFAHLLAICQFLPGPSSSQLGFSIGLLRGGWLGGLAAFIGFTLPSAIVLVLFALGLPLLSGGWTEAALQGLKIVAFVVVADGVIGMSRKLCPDAFRQTLAIGAAALLLLTGIIYMQLMVIGLGALLGAGFCKEKSQAPDVLGTAITTRFGIISLILFFLLLLGLPVLALLQVDLLQIAHVFYQAGSLVFGGGHVVLPWLEASLIETGVVSEDAFLAGYGLSQAIPGPLFTFAAYIGVLWPSELSWLVTATVALIFIFLPGFLLVCGVLPFWQNIAAKPSVANAMAGVNAAVVGILGAALFQPIFIVAILTPADMAIALVAFWLVSIRKLSVLYAVVWCVVLSMMRYSFL